LDGRQGGDDRLRGGCLRNGTEGCRRTGPPGSRRRAHLSFDVDALDPAFAPGTGTPEVGGLATWQARAILRRLGGLYFAGMDVVEVSPPYDVAEITALAAATMAWDYIGLLAPHPSR
jgi:arginase family enzyme